VKSGTGTLAKAQVRRFTALPQAAASSVAQRTLYFSEQLQDPTNPNSPTTFFITQDGMTPEAYTMGRAPNIVVHSGTVETWVIQNSALEDHIFHIHQIHFQVLAVNGVAVNDPANPRYLRPPLLDRTGRVPEHHGSDGLPRPEYRRHIRLSLPHPPT
jgi:FtsP/CotA-like multicopper oxidase with cupredoxin domain